jgi:flagellar FliJ protein
MKKFVFRLETLLQHRRNVEEQERTKFTLIRNELHAECGRRQSFMASQDRTRAELAGILSTDCNAQECQWCSRFLEYLALEIKRSDERIAGLEKKLEAQKQTMIAATRDKKIIEKLKARKQKEFQISLERMEQKAIDEIVITRYAARD